MKITRITPIMADGGHRIIVFVKVETDQPGLIGWGEATLEGKPRAIVGCIQDMEPMIVGQDPRRIEHCWQILYRSGFWRMGVIGLSAISGIDQALWDIKGKDLGVPVYELLGGRVRDKVRVYTHFTGPSASAGDRTQGFDAAVENARSKVERGWTAIKTVGVPITNALDGPNKLKYAEAFLKTIREAVGDDIDILLDLHGRLTPQMAIQYGKRFEPYNPLFLEEPVQAENPKMMASVARALSTPIATGERLFLRWGFREILELGAASLLQPDPCHAGGISETRKIATMAETYYAGLSAAQSLRTARDSGVRAHRSRFAELRHPGDDRPGDRAGSASFAQRPAGGRRRSHLAADQTRPRRRSRRSRMRAPRAGFLHRQSRRHGDAVLPRYSRRRWGR